MDIVPAYPAPEFKDIVKWANSEPMSIKDLKGKVVLLDCLTYTCIFCLRTIPIVKRLHEKYSKKYGFLVIQAHSAEYEFARNIQNIQKALSYYDVSNIPVAFDINNRTWEAYGNTYWPKHILIDHNNFIRYEHAGYGRIEEFENPVVELLDENGCKPTEDIDNENPQDEIFDTYGMHFYGIAPEICIGYSRLRRFGNNQTMKPNEPNMAIDPDSHMENVVYLSGKWIWERVEVKMDGNYLTKEQLGKHMKLKNGISYADVEWPFMHNLIRTEKPEVHEVQVIPRSSNFVFNTFVFG